MLNLLIAVPLPSELRESLTVDSGRIVMNFFVVWEALLGWTLDQVF